MDLKDALPAIAEGDMMGYEDPVKRPFYHIYKPIIAAVNGLCIAGGLEFLQGMDMRIASDKAIFGLGEVKWGVIPAGGTHIRLPQQIPWAVAMEMVLAGDNITAERAYQIGLVNKIVPTDQVLPEAMALAERICQNGPLAVRTAKEIMVRSLNNEPGFVLEKTMGRACLPLRRRQGRPARLRRKTQAGLYGKVGDHLAGQPLRMSSITLRAASSFSGSGGTGKRTPSARSAYCANNALRDDVVGGPTPPECR